MLETKKNGYLINEIPFGLRGKIFQSPMPFSLYDPENCVWSLYLQNKINFVVVLAERREMLTHTQRDLLKFYTSNKLEVIHYPIQDLQIPLDPIGFDKVITNVINQAKSGAYIACHCLAGLGRTGLLLAAIAKKSLGLSGKDAIHWIRNFIPGAIENTEQERFIHRLKDY